MAMIDERTTVYRCPVCAQPVIWAQTGDGRVIALEPEGHRVGYVMLTMGAIPPALPRARVLAPLDAHQQRRVQVLHRLHRDGCAGRTV